MKYWGLLVAILVASILRIFIFSSYKVQSFTMAPTLVSGDYVIASKISFGFYWPVTNTKYFASHPKRSELLSYTRETKTIIKRVIAVAGDKYSYSKGKLRLNSTNCLYTEDPGPVPEGSKRMIEQCEEERRAVLVPQNLELNSQDFEESVLGDNEILVASDNRSFENASNAIEVIKLDQIVGKPLLVWTSIASTQDFISEQSGIRWNRILTKLR